MISLGKILLVTLFMVFVSRKYLGGFRILLLFFFMYEVRLCFYVRSSTVFHSNRFLLGIIFFLRNFVYFLLN